MPKTNLFSPDQALVFTIENLSDVEKVIAANIEKLELLDSKYASCVMLHLNKIIDTYYQAAKLALADKDLIEADNYFSKIIAIYDKTYPFINDENQALKDKLNLSVEKMDSYYLHLAQIGKLVILSRKTNHLSSLDLVKEQFFALKNKLSAELNALFNAFNLAIEEKATHQSIKEIAKNILSYINNEYIAHLKQHSSSPTLK